MNNIEEYMSNMEKQQFTIENFPLEVNVGTKRMQRDYHNKAIQDRNALIEGLKKQYESDLATLSQKLQQIACDFSPEKPSERIAVLEEKLILLEQILSYSNEYNDVTDKLDLERSIYYMDDQDNSTIKDVNDILLDIIHYFSQAQITLNANDFNYSPFTMQYMNFFFEQMSSDDFNDVMEDKFNEIYWYCPNLFKHLKTNIKYLIRKYDKKLSELYKRKKAVLFQQLNINETNYLDTFLACQNELNVLVAQDPYLNMKKFLNKELIIDDYLANSPLRTRSFQKFLKADDFNSFTPENKEKFYLFIIELGNAIEEVEQYRFFEPLIQDLVAKIEKKDSNPINLSSKWKELKKNEKKRIAKVKQYTRLADSNTSHKKLNKMNTLLKEIEDQIVFLDQLYNEIDVGKLCEICHSNIDEGSTILDAMKLIDSFYDYLANLITSHFHVTKASEIDKYVEMFHRFLNNSNNVIVNKINLFHKNDLELMLGNKCKLFGINLDCEMNENIDALKHDIAVLKQIYYIENSNITFDQIKFICEVQKMS